MINIRSKYVASGLIILILLASIIVTWKFMDSEGTSSAIADADITISTSTSSDTLELCKEHPEVVKYVFEVRHRNPELRVGADPGTYGELHTCVVTYFQEETQKDIRVIFPFRVVK